MKQSNQIQLFSLIRKYNYSLRIKLNPLKSHKLIVQVTQILRFG